MPSPHSVSALLALCCAASALAQSYSASEVRKKRANELTLAGLRPGRSTLGRAVQLFGTGDGRLNDRQVSHWHDACLQKDMFIDSSLSRRIESVRVTEVGTKGVANCPDPQKNKEAWATGHGLAVGNPASRVIMLYGNPESRSPSTKGGQQLELLYYAFDWAGPDVPQVMEVLCTPDKDGTPGRVVEITLAAPSL
jgi:hypothetical protein